ncbi:MAG: HAD-IA family hydrolase [Parvibaculum sp.]
MLHKTQQRLHALSVVCDRSEDDVRSFLIHSEIIDQLDLGHAQATDLATKLSELAGKEISPEQAITLWLKVFEPNRWLWKNLQRLASHFSLGIFSNNPPFVVRLFPRDMNFTYVFLSSQFGAMKPDIAVFKAVQASLSWAPDQILFIDDKPENIYQARSIGWNALQFKNNKQLDQDLIRLGLW